MFTFSTWPWLQAASCLPLRARPSSTDLELVPWHVDDDALPQFRGKLVQHFGLEAADHQLTAPAATAARKGLNDKLNFCPCQLLHSLS